MKLDEERGELAPAERDMLESEADRQLRERLQSDRDQAANYMRFEYEALIGAMVGARSDAVLQAIHVYATTVVRYLFCRKSLELVGFDPGDFPEWYAKLIDDARRNGH